MVKYAGELTCFMSFPVKQTTKDAYYGSIIIAGVGVTCLLFYAIFRELFSKESPNGIYTKSLNICLETPRLVDALGQPVKGYGKTTSRGRRRHPSYVEYVQDGVNHIRMKFYVEGSRRKGTVHQTIFFSPIFPRIQMGNTSTGICSWSCPTSRRKP